MKKAGSELAQRGRTINRDNVAASAFALLPAFARAADDFDAAPGPHSSLIGARHNDC